DFVDLRSFIKTDAAFSPQAFIPGGIDMLTEPGGLPDAGKILGLPWAFWTQSFGYNDAVWEKAGINPPADNWTWDDFKQIAKKFTTDTNGDGQADTHGAVVLVNVNRLGMILHNAGTFWFDRPILPLQSRLTDPKVLSVLDDLSQLYRQGVITNDGKSYNTGATAMYAAIAPNALSQTLRDQGVIQKFMRSPHWPNGQTGSELSVLSYSILQSSQHPKEAWEWIKFLTLNKQNQLALVNDPQFARIPANLTAMQQYFKAKAEVEPTITKFMDEVVSPESYARPEHPKLPQITNVLQKSLEKALLGAQSVSVKEAMLQANTQIEPILAEYR
ncbi:MAG TPA: extracellular solute-binding protein, partial [Limnochordia bacterium]|nr:extracellular solute-binding protein [Limnochordia bacterium]